MTHNSFYQWQDNALILHVYIQPKASKDEITGIYNDQLKIRITSPPVDGKANAHLRKFLSRTFRVSQSQIELMKGETSRHKTFKIISPRQLPEHIDK